MRLAWLIAAIIFFIELQLKTYLYSAFSGKSIPLIKNIFHITLVENTGAAFGILQGKTLFLTCIGIIFIIFFISIIKKEKRKNLTFLLACGLVMGGAVSNLYDRIFLGFVIDYIDLRIWPVFNLADSSICVGIGLLMLHSQKSQKSKTVK